MPDVFGVLLDQNVPQSVAAWLRAEKPNWHVWHTIELGLEAAADPQVFQWAQEHQAVIVTYDGDFADQRQYPLGGHHGIVRLRVYPTTAEATQGALLRLILALSEDELRRSLVVVTGSRVRWQPAPGS